jgi:hypothetical protein
LESRRAEFVEGQRVGAGEMSGLKFGRGAHIENGAGASLAEDRMEGMW